HPGRTFLAVPTADTGHLPLLARRVDLLRPLGLSGRRLGRGVREGQGREERRARASRTAERRTALKLHNRRLLPFTAKRRQRGCTPECAGYDEGGRAPRRG